MPQTSLQTAVRLAQRKRRTASMPEGFNSPTNQFADGDTIVDADVTRQASVLFSCELIYDTTGPNSGIIFDFGGTTTGALVGISTTELVVRYGSGGSVPLSDGARFTLAVGLLPKNRKFKLSWAFVIGIGVYVWIDGRRVGFVAETGTVTAWAGANDGGYGIAHTPPSETGLTVTYDGTLFSYLRYYERVPDFLG